MMKCTVAAPTTMQLGSVPAIATRVPLSVCQIVPVVLLGPLLWLGGPVLPLRPHSFER